MRRWGGDLRRTSDRHWRRGIGRDITMFPPCWSGGEVADMRDRFGATTETDSGRVGEFGGNARHS